MNWSDYSKLVESGVRVKKSLVKGDDEKISELKEPSLKTSRKEEKEKGGEASKQNQSYFSQGSYRTDDRSNKN